MRDNDEPVYDIIDWFAADPDIQSVLGVSTPQDAMVFFPVQQDPMGGIPYVRYSTSTNVSPDDYWMRRDNISMALYFVSVRDSARMMNIIIDKVKAGDASARDLNKFLRDTATQDYKSPFTFKHLEWVDGGTTQPTEERGGAHARVLTFRCSYTVATGLHIS